MRLPSLLLLLCSHGDVVFVCGGRCGVVMRGEEGVITSPQYPQSYRSNLYCVTTIHLKKGNIVHLKWDTFRIPGRMPHCGGDFVRITRCTSPFVHLITYCGNQLPNSIYSYEQCLRIEFRSTNHMSSLHRTTPRYFRLQYETLDTSTFIPYSSNCLAVRTTNQENSTKTLQSKLIFTPGWPLSYSGRVPNNGCQERIGLGVGKRAKILFMGLDLYTPVTERPCHQLSNDVLIVRGVTEKEETFSYVYCGKRPPFSVDFRHPFKYIDLIFVTGSSRTHNHKGFVLGVLVFNDNRTEERAFSVPLIPTLVSFGVICLLMFCFMQTMKTCCHRNLIQHTRRHRSARGLGTTHNMTMDAYHHDNNPPPYSLNDHVTSHEPILVPIPPYQVSDVRTPPPPYRRNDGPHPPPYDHDGPPSNTDRENNVVARENIVVARENIVVARESVVVARENVVVRDSAVTRDDNAVAQSDTQK